MKHTQLILYVAYPVCTLLLLWVGARVPSTIPDLVTDLTLGASAAFAAMMANRLKIRGKSLLFRGGVRGGIIWLGTLIVFTLGLTAVAIIRTLIDLWPSMGLLALPGLVLIPLSIPFTFVALIVRTRTLILMILFVGLGSFLEKTNRQATTGR